MEVAEWVFDNIGAKDRSQYLSEPPSEGAEDLLTQAQEDKSLFYDKIWAPQLKSEIQAASSRGSLRDDDRDLSQRLFRIERRARAIGNALEAQAQPAV